MLKSRIGEGRQRAEHIPVVARLAERGFDAPDADENAPARRRTASRLRAMCRPIARICAGRWRCVRATPGSPDRRPSAFRIPAPAASRRARQDPASRRQRRNRMLRGEIPCAAASARSAARKASKVSAAAQCADCGDKEREQAGKSSPQHRERSASTSIHRVASTSAIPARRRGVPNARRFRVRASTIRTTRGEVLDSRTRSSIGIGTGLSSPTMRVRSSGAGSTYSAGSPPAAPARAPATRCP